MAIGESGRGARLATAGVVLLLSATLVGFYFAGRSGDRSLAMLAAVLAGVVLTGAVVALALRYWQASREAEVPAAVAFAKLMALAWAWGGAAMLATYPLGGLKWQHGWQYGAGMVLIAMLVCGYASLLAQPMSRLAAPSAMGWARLATRLQSLAACAGVAWLMLSGKLETSKGDWAANDIFLAGGFALTALSDASLAVRRRLMRPR